MKISPELTSFAQKIEDIYEACPKLNHLCIQYGQKEITKPFSSEIVPQFDVIFQYYPLPNDTTEIQNHKIKSLIKVVGEALTEAALNTGIITLEENNRGPYYKPASREVEIALRSGFNRGEVLQNMQDYVEHNLVKGWKFEAKLQEIKHIDSLTEVPSTPKFR